MPETPNSADGFFVARTNAEPSDAEPPDDEYLLYWAWTIIANAYEGDWDAATPEWKDAAERWRDRWHEHLAGRNLA